MVLTRAWEQRYAELEAMVADACASMKAWGSGSDHFERSGDESLPYSSQLSDSSGFNRPDLKPIYEIKADKEIPKASSKSKRRYKLQKRISCEELDERTMKGLCVFCEEPETPGHYLQHMNSSLLMIDSEDHLSDSMVNEIANEISSDRWLPNSIGCESEIDETDNDEDRVPSNSDLIVNDSEKVKKDLVAIDIDSETDLLAENNQQIQEQVENHSMNSVPEASWVPHMCWLLKHQVSTSHLAFSHRSSIGSRDVYDDWPSAIVRTHQSQSNFDLEYADINAYQVCDSMSLGTRLLTNGRRKTFLKTWRFKFKDKTQPRELLQEKVGVHEANATRNQLRSPIGFADDDLHYDCGSDTLCVQYLVSSVAVGDFQDTQWLFNDALKDIQKFQIVNEEGSNSYAFQAFNGISLISHILHHPKKPSKSPKSWKFKFKISSEDTAFVFKMDHWCRARYINLETESFLEIEVMQEQQAVYEQIITVNEWLYQISLVSQQVMSNTKLKLSKRWWFKYKYGKEGIQRLQIQLRYKSWLELEERFKIWSRGESWRKQKESQQFTMETEEEMKDMMEEDLKQQQGDSEPLVTVPDLDAKFSGGVSMDKKQFHLSLRTNRVWDPGG